MAARRCQDETVKQWYALRSKPRRESSAAALLTKAGIEVYLPQTRVHKQPGRGPILEPFFPGYLFGQLDPLLGDVRLVKYTPGILHIVGYGDEPWPVPDDLIAAIQERLTRGREALAHTGFRPGDRVVITGGPLRDVDAIFDCGLSATGRVRVLVRILGSLRPADVHVAQLRPANKAAEMR